MNDITKFTDASAKAYAETIEKNRSSRSMRIADNLIKYIEKRYEKVIKKVIKHNSTARKAEISLPYFKRIYDDITYKEATTVIHEHFLKLGFDVTITKPHHCLCLFDGLCNYGEFKAKINW